MSFPMPLDHKIQLCYINLEDFWQWIKGNHLLTQDFTQEKEKWNKEISQKPSFFSDTELLFIYQDIILLKTLTDSQVVFLAKVYQLEHQNVCQKLFQEKKNIIIISDRQWKTSNNPERPKEQEKNEKAIILFKDQESIENKLADWLRSFGV